MYRRFLRVRFVELRRRIINIQMWELSNFYQQFINRVVNNGEPARSQIMAHLSEVLGSEFVLSTNLGDRLVITDHGSEPGSTVYANVMLNTLALSSLDEDIVMRALDGMPKDRFDIVFKIAVPYLGEDYLQERFSGRYDDLKLSTSPYKD